MAVVLFKAKAKTMALKGKAKAKKLQKSKANVKDLGSKPRIRPLMSFFLEML